MAYLSRLKAYLTGRPEFTGIRIRDSYDGAIKGEPLTGPVITLGLQGLTFRQAFLEESAPLEAEVQVRFLLYSPLRAGSGGQCLRLQGALLRGLLFSLEFPFYSFICGKVEAQRDAGAYVLEVHAKCRSYLSREEALQWSL